jgi:hypothetical protein
MTESEAKDAVIEAAEKFAKTFDEGAALPENPATAELVQAACEHSSLEVYLAVQRLKETRMAQTREATP